MRMARRLRVEDEHLSAYWRRRSGGHGVGGRRWGLGGGELASGSRWWLVGGRARGDLVRSVLYG